MINIKNADLTNGTQKIFAGVILAIILAVLYFLLPPLVFILQNIWLLVVLGVPLVLLIYNYEILWTVLKRWSWNMTKKIISSDKLWYMYQGYEYMLKRIEDLNQSIVQVGSIRNHAQSTINKMIQDSDDWKKQAVAAQNKKAPESVIRILANKISVNSQQIEKMLPKLDYVKTNEQKLRELYDCWSADTEILKHTLDAKAEEYNLIKELSAASDNAKTFLSKDTPELRNYNESLKQIEQSISDYTSNVENFQRNAAPTILNMSIQSDANSDDGMKLIEEYKAKRIKL